MDENNYIQDPQYNPNVQNQQYIQNPQYTQNTQYTQNPQYTQNTQYTQNSQYMQNQQYTQNAQNIQNLQRQQSSQFGANPQANKDGNNVMDDPEQAWKAAIAIGIINVVLAIACGSFRIRIMSAGLIVLLLAGVYGSFSSIKGGLKERKSTAVIMGIIAMIINVAATGYYIWSIIYTIGSKFS